jgi:hypothetical protein
MATLGRRLENHATMSPELITAVLSEREDVEYPIAIAKSEPDRFFTFASVIWSLEETYQATVRFGAPCFGGASLNALRLHSAHHRATASAN